MCAQAQKTQLRQLLRTSGLFINRFALSPLMATGGSATFRWIVLHPDFHTKTFLPPCGRSTHPAGQPSAQLGNADERPGYGNSRCFRDTSRRERFCLHALCLLGDKSETTLSEGKDFDGCKSATHPIRQESELDDDV